MHKISNANKLKKHLEQRSKDIERKICLLGIYFQVDRKFRKTEEKLYKNVKARLGHELVKIFLRKKGVKPHD